MFEIVCVTARALCPGDFLSQLERVAAAGACVMSGLMTAPDPARLVGQLRKEAGE